MTATPASLTVSITRAHHITLSAGRYASFIENTFSWKNRCIACRVLGGGMLSTACDIRIEI